MEINFFKEIFNKNKFHTKSRNKDILIYQIIRDSIDLMVKDLINNTIKNIKKYNLKSNFGIMNCKNQIVEFSDKFKDIESEIKYFLRLNMYNNKNVLSKNENGKKIIKILFNKISKNPKKFINLSFSKKDNFRVISDYISGMTDRYAINLYKKIR